MQVQDEVTALLGRIERELPRVADALLSDSLGDFLGAIGWLRSTLDELRRLSGPSGEERVVRVAVELRERLRRALKAPRGVAA